MKAWLVQEGIEIMITRRLVLIGVLGSTAVAGIGGGAAAFWFGDADASGAVFTDEDGVAIRGYDPVAYFTDGRPVEGSEAFTAEHLGATWWFASAESRDRFAADPEAYRPQYGGYCAWAVAEKNRAYPIDPAAWRVVDGKLYLNFNADIQAKWEEDVPGFITEADRNWPGLQQQLQEAAS